MNGYVIAAAISVLSAVAAYWVRFSLLLHHGLSSEPTTWSEFGSYMGGVLGPILSFFTLIFMIKTLDSQNKANAALRKEAEDNEKAEQLKSFSALLFNMIDSQKSLVDKFKLDFPSGNMKVVKRGAEAVTKIEEEIQIIRNRGGSDEHIEKYIASIDSSDQLFGVVRAFYICVKMISEKLSDHKGFSLETRREYFNTLINFTDFLQIRLIIVCIQFSKWESAKYLRQNDEFLSVLKDAGAKLNPY